MAKELSPQQMRDHLCGEHIDKPVRRYMKWWNLHEHVRLEKTKEYIEDSKHNLQRIWRQFKVLEGPVQLGIILGILIALGIGAGVLHLIGLSPFWVFLPLIAAFKTGVVASIIAFLKGLLIWGGKVGFKGKILWTVLKTLFLVYKGATNIYIGTVKKWHRWQTAYQFSQPGLYVSSWNKEVFFNSPPVSGTRYVGVILLSIGAIVASTYLAPGFVTVLGKVAHLHIEHPGAISIGISWFVLMWLLMWIPQLYWHENERQALRFSALRYFVDGQRGFWLHNIRKVLASLWFFKKENRVRFRPFKGKFWKKVGMSGYHAFLTSVLNPEKFGPLVAPRANTLKEKLLSPFQQLETLKPCEIQDSPDFQQAEFLVPYNTRYVVVPTDTTMVDAALIPDKEEGAPYKKIVITTFTAKELTYETGISFCWDKKLPTFWERVRNSYHRDTKKPVFKLYNKPKDYRWVFVMENA